MNVRYWLSPQVFHATKDQQNALRINLDGATQVVSQEGGLLFFDTGLSSPTSPKLHKGIVRVTFQTTIEDASHQSILDCGRYVHGRFEAKVNRVSRAGKHLIDIEASAPTASLLRRWLNVLLAGKDEPVDRYDGSNTFRGLSPEEAFKVPQRR